MRYRVTLKQKFTRYVTLEVDAPGALAAIDHAERLAPNAEWGQPMPSEVEISKVEPILREVSSTRPPRSSSRPLEADAVLMLPAKGARCKLCLQPFVTLSGGVQGCAVHGIRDAVVNGERHILVAKTARAYAWVKDNVALEPWQHKRWIVGSSTFMAPLVEGLKKAGLRVEERRGV